MPLQRQCEAFVCNRYDQSSERCTKTKPRGKGLVMDVINDASSRAQSDDLTSPTTVCAALIQCRMIDA